MMKVDNFISNLEEIKRIFAECGFLKAVLFKGFVPQEKHQCYVYVKSGSLSQSPEPIRCLHAQDRLEDLLRVPRSSIEVQTKDQIRDVYFSKINSTNSVDLMSLSAAQDLQRVFGVKWNFNPPYSSLSNAASRATFQVGQFPTKASSGLSLGGDSPVPLSPKK